MKRQVILYKKDFTEIWTLIIQGYNFWNNANRKDLAYVSGTKTQMKQFIKIILHRAIEVLDDFPNDSKLKKEINQLKLLLHH